MVTIIKGSNDPLVLEVKDIDLNTIDKISVVLASYGNEKKSWTKDTIRIQDNYLILPLTELETLAFSRGDYILDAKFLENGHVRFTSTIKYKVVDRDNKTVLTEEAPT